MSVLRQLQTEWNTLVPQAQSRGLRGVREVRLYPQGLHERITHRRARLEWLRRELNLTTALSAVTPEAGAFTFGVELECIVPHGRTLGELARAIANTGLDCRHEVYNHTPRPWWKVVTDGSLGDYNHGAEIVSPASPPLVGDDGLAQLRKVCAAATAFGCRVTKKCGLHVHIGARGESIEFFKSLVRLYATAEPVIDSFLAPSRRADENTYCQPVRVNHAALDVAVTLDDVTRAMGQTPGAAYARNSSRYCKLNLQAFAQHGTVEFRQHQGTVESDKAENWVRLCLRMALASRKGAPPVNTLEALLATIGASETESRYFMSRVAYFENATRRALARATAVLGGSYTGRLPS